MFFVLMVRRQKWTSAISSLEINIDRARERKKDSVRFFFFRASSRVNQISKPHFRPIDSKIKENHSLTAHSFSSLRSTIIFPICWLATSVKNRLATSTDQKKNLGTSWNDFFSFLVFRRNCEHSRRASATNFIKIKAEPSVGEKKNVEIVWKIFFFFSADSWKVRV